MRWPWVSRALLDEVRNDRDAWRRRADLLLDQLNNMRRDGFIVPKPHKVSTPGMEPEEEGKLRAEALLRRRVFLDRAVAKMRAEHPKLTDSQLAAEATRLYDATIMQDVPS